MGCNVDQSDLGNPCVGSIWESGPNHLEKGLIYPILYWCLTDETLLLLQKELYK